MSDSHFENLKAAVARKEARKKRRALQSDDPLQNLKAAVARKEARKKRRARKKRQPPAPLHSPPPSDDDYISIEEVCRMIGGDNPISRVTAYRMIQRGLLSPPEKPTGPGGISRWRRGRIRASLDARAAAQNGKSA